VVAYSSGNHAQAVALSARLLGTTAVIVMPTDTPASKLAAVRGYGAEIVTYDRWTGDRAALGATLAGERGLTLIAPYDVPHVIAGQGTAALELLEDVPDLDVIVVPVGGGGLAAGTSTIASDIRPGIRVVGVEPAAGDDTFRSLAEGRRVAVDMPRTIADGQGAPIPGELTFPIMQRLLHGVVLVSDDEIREAMRFAFDRLKVVLEPSGASGLAAVLCGRLPSDARRIGVVLSGGNVDTVRFAELLAH
jgi:threonine dehydratase